MSIVKMGRKWEINTKEDYDKAMEILDGNEFCAEMSDDFLYWQREKAEVARQRAEVTAQAKAKGII
jgi:adenylylsulfate kinase-like enzyme